MRHRVGMVRAEVAIKETDIDERDGRKGQQSIYPDSKKRVLADVRVHPKNVNEHEEQDKAEPFVGALPNVVGKRIPYRYDDEACHYDYRGHTEVLPQKIGILPWHPKPHVHKKGTKLRKLIRGEEKRMQENDPEAPSPEPLVDLIHLVLSPKKVFQKSPSCRKNHAPEHQHHR